MLFVLLAFVLLFPSAFLVGQSSSSDMTSSNATHSSTSQPESDHRTYISGFEIVNPGKAIEDLELNDREYYPSKVLGKVRSKRCPQIPELQKSIGKQTGVAVVEFEVKRNGSLGNVTTVESAPDMSMDAAATQAIFSCGVSIRCRILTRRSR